MLPPQGVWVTKAITSITYRVSLVKHFEHGAQDIGIKNVCRSRTISELFIISVLRHYNHD